MKDKLISIQEFEAYAAAALPKTILEYYANGACDELTLSNNQDAFNKLRIVPRVLRDIRKRDLSLTVHGDRVEVPIGVSPCAMHKLAHDDGECATARAAEKYGSVIILSTLSTCSMEEVAEAAPNAIKWFQLYTYKNKDLTKSLIGRAEKAGFKALVLTVDLPGVHGIRYKDIKNNFTLPSHLKLGNFINETAKIDPTQGSGLTKYVMSLFDDGLCWKDITWIKIFTKLPIIVKGILSPEDAKIAADIGCSGVFVSNHGGRQLDTAVATIEALPSIVRAVGDRVDVYLDGGVRHGIDVLKAIALGAKLVFFARPILWGLTYDGQKGAEEVLDILISEFDNSMALSGCSSLDKIGKDMIVHESELFKL